MDAANYVQRPSINFRQLFAAFQQKVKTIFLLVIDKDLLPVWLLKLVFLVVGIFTSIFFLLIGVKSNRGIKQGLFIIMLAWLLLETQSNLTKIPLIRIGKLFNGIFADTLDSWFKVKLSSQAIGATIVSIVITSFIFPFLVEDIYIFKIIVTTFIVGEIYSLYLPNMKATIIDSGDTVYKKKYWLAELLIVFVISVGMNVILTWILDLMLFLILCFFYSNIIVIIIYQCTGFPKSVKDYFEVSNNTMGISSVIEPASNNVTVLELNFIESLVEGFSGTFSATINFVMSLIRQNGNDNADSSKAISLTFFTLVFFMWRWWPKNIKEVKVRKRTLEREN
ncbi:hypothetical protein GINT2_001771 [Glugoides intestinalis]